MKQVVPQSPQVLLRAAAIFGLVTALILPVNSIVAFAEETPTEVVSTETPVESTPTSEPTDSPSPEPSASEAIEVGSEVIVEETPVTDPSPSVEPSPEVTESASPTPSPTVSIPLVVVNAPTNLNFTPVVEGIKLTWDKTDSEIDKYIVKIDPDNRQVDVSKDASELLIADLDRKASYSFSIWAVFGEVSSEVTGPLTVDLSTVKFPRPPMNAEVGGLIVKFEDQELSSQDLTNIADTTQLQPVSLEVSSEIATDTHLVEFNQPVDVITANEIADALEANNSVEYAELDFAFLTASETSNSESYVPNDPLYATKQWSLWGNFGVGVADGPTGLALAYQSSTGLGSVVAVIDTGFTNHPDLEGQFVSGYDFVSNNEMLSGIREENGNPVPYDGDYIDSNTYGPIGWDDNPQDPGDWNSTRSSSWHGTYIAGLIAAKTNNGIGIAGIAPDAKIQPIRAFSWRGGLLSDVIASITWASGGNVENVPANQTPAKVINLSFSVEAPCTPSLQLAIDEAISRGSVVVAAAGNNNQDAANFAPGNCQNVITVGAINSDGEKAAYSNFGASVDISAPGGELDGQAIYSTSNEGTTTSTNPAYVVRQGTSIATAQVSAALAKIMSSNTKEVIDFKNELLKNTKKIISNKCSTNESDCQISILFLISGYNSSLGQYSINPGGGRESNGSDGIRVNINTTGSGITGGASSGGDQLWYQNTYQYCCSAGAPFLAIGSYSFGSTFASVDSDWTAIEFLSKSGTATSNASSTDKGNASLTIRYKGTTNGLDYFLKRNIVYTYPNNYIRETYTITIPTGNTETVKFYLGGDTAPGSSDAGKGLKVTGSRTTVTITNKQLTSNVATLTTSSAHNLKVGWSTTISGVDSTFNGTYTITAVPTSTSFSYSKTATDVVSTSVTSTSAIATTGIVATPTSISSVNQSSNIQFGFREVGGSSPFTKTYVGHYSAPRSVIGNGQDLTETLDTNNHDAGLDMQWTVGSTPGDYEFRMEQFVSVVQTSVYGSFNDSSVNFGSNSSTTLTLENGTNAAADDVGFTFTLPTNLYVNDSITDTCSSNTGTSETISGALNATSVVVSGIDLAALSSCTITIPLTGPINNSGYTLNSSSISSLAGGINNTMGISKLIIVSATQTAPTFTNSSPNNSITKSSAYSYTFLAEGSPVPSYSVSSGSLPTGMTLSDAGELAGTPTTAGTYTFTVAASNGVSPSASASVTMTVIDPNAPGAPTINSITSGDQQLSINFTAPGSSGSSSISNYEYSTNGGSTWTTLSPTSTSSPIVVSGLTNGTSYTVLIRAVNGSGSGSSSNSVTATAGTSTSGGGGSSSPTPTPSPTITSTTNRTPTPRPTNLINNPLAIPTPTPTPSLIPGTVNRPEPLVPRIIDSLINALRPRVVDLTTSPTPQATTNSTSQPQSFTNQQALQLAQPTEDKKVVELPSLVLVDNIYQPSKVVIVDNTSAQIVTPGGGLLNVAAKDGEEKIPVDNEGRVQMVRNNNVETQGQGLAPNTEFAVYLFSDPILLGVGKTDNKGQFFASFPVEDELPIGDHTLQVNGLLPDGKTASVSMPVVIVDSIQTAKNQAMPETVLVNENPVDKALRAVYWILVVLAAMVFLIAVANRNRFFALFRRRDEDDDLQTV